MAWVTAAPHLARSVSKAPGTDSQPRNGWGSFLDSPAPAPPAGSADVRVAVGNKLLMQEQDVEIPAHVDSYMRKMEVRACCRPLLALRKT